MKHDNAQLVAERLIGWLDPVCERIEVAGSVRRGKAEVKDIEILAIPKPEMPKVSFGQTKVFPRLLEQALYTMETLRGLIEPIKGGMKYKQFWLLESHTRLIMVDLFLVTPPSVWGVQMVIRTGPMEFSQWMVTPKSKGGALPDGHHVEQGAVWRDIDDLRIETQEEKDFFHLCGLEYIEPCNRKARWHER